MKSEQMYLIYRSVCSGDSNLLQDLQDRTQMQSTDEAMKTKPLVNSLQ